MMKCNLIPCLGKHLLEIHYEAGEVDITRNGNFKKTLSDIQKGTYITSPTKSSLECSPMQGIKNEFKTPFM